MTASRVDRFEQWAAPLLAVVMVLFLAAYAWPILDPDLARGWRRTCSVVVWASWVVFVVDFLVRLRLAEDRWAFVRRNPIDLAAMLLPFLRPLRLLRLVTLLSVAERLGGRTLRGRVGVYLVGSASMLVLVASLAVLDAERGHGGSIQSFGDALWWAVTTITTVGYGDMYPVTTTGRLVAAGLMVSGIAALGVVTASIASWLVEHISDQAETQSDALEEIEQLRSEVARLRAALESDPRDTIAP